MNVADQRGLGDVLIVGTSLMNALALVGASDWPRRRFAAVAAAAIVTGLAYTVYSERLNLARGAWGPRVGDARAAMAGDGPGTGA